MKIYPKAQLTLLQVIHNLNLGGLFKRESFGGGLFNGMFQREEGRGVHQV